MPQIQYATATMLLIIFWTYCSLHYQFAPVSSITLYWDHISHGLISYDCNVPSLHMENYFTGTEMDIYQTCGSPAGYK